VKKPVRIILRYSPGSYDLTAQARAALTALEGNIQPGELWGVRIDGAAFGVKRNDAGSVSVFPQGEAA
jgi:hypothetical protein